MQQRQDRGWAGQGLASDHGTKASALGCRQKMLRTGRQSSFFFRWRRRARGSICDERSPMTAGLVILLALLSVLPSSHLAIFIAKTPTSTRDRPVIHDWPLPENSGCKVEKQAQ